MFVLLRESYLDFECAASHWKYWYNWFLLELFFYLTLCNMYHTFDKLKRYIMCYLLLYLMFVSFLLISLSAEEFKILVPLDVKSLMYIVCLHKREKITGTVINCIGGPWLKRSKQTTALWNITMSPTLNINMISKLENVL